MNDEYEILPHKLLEDLKYDVEALKRKLSEPEAAAQELIAEIGDLKDTIKELHNVFREALQDIKEEDSTKLLASLQNKIETITTQNETIARGMIAISDKLEDFMKARAAPKPALPTPSLTPLPGPSQITPPPGPFHPPISPSKAPPPPPGMKPKRTGIFR